MDGHSIDARRYYTTPIHCQHVFQNHPQFEANLPITEQLGASLVAIPVMHELTDTEIERVIDALNSFHPE